ncbi:transposable element Tc1 transposase [Trichonephila clavipes]|nr:transposable element Tc1 transposase [Trichonephila clavipes]
MTRRRVENRERSLGYPGFVTPVFTKESKPLGKKEKITRAPRDCDTHTHLKKSLVYADKPQTLDHLEDNIRRVIADIRPQMLEKIIENWTSTLDYIRASRGSPMPEIIFKMHISGRVGRNQTNVMRICDRWMQEGTTDRRGRSHPPQCTTSREERQIVRMAVTDRSVPSRTVAQHIESVTHHSVSARTIRRRLQQSGLSARRPLLSLLLTQNHRRLCHQWCDERRMWVAEWNEVVFTDESRICLQHHDGRIRVWRQGGERMLNSSVMHRHTGPAPVIMGLATAIFQQDNARPHVARIVQMFFVNHQIELLLWPARSPDLSPIENMWSIVAQRLTQITPPPTTPDQLWQRVEAAWSAVPQKHIQSHFESMPRRVAAVNSNNGVYSGY